MQNPDRLRKRQSFGVDYEISRDWLFVGRTEPGKFLYFSTSRACVKSLGISCFANLNSGVDMDFKKAFADSSTRGFPLCEQRGDKRGDDDKTSLFKQKGDFGNTTHIFCAIFYAETQVCIESGTQRVTVEHDRLDTLRVKAVLQPARKRRLSRTGQPREPQYTSVRSVCRGGHFRISYFWITGPECIYIPVFQHHCVLFLTVLFGAIHSRVNEKLWISHRYPAREF